MSLQSECISENISLSYVGKDEAENSIDVLYNKRISIFLGILQKEGAINACILIRIPDILN
jgi:hypothetical protein